MSAALWLYAVILSLPHGDSETDRNQDRVPDELTSTWSAEAVQSFAALIDGDGEIRLTLEEYVQLVLVRNLNLEIVRLANDSTETAVGLERGAFDPLLFASASGSYSESPTASSFVAPANQRLSSSLGIQGLGSTGLTYNLTYDFSYQRQSPSNPFFGLNPTFLSTVNFGLSQPLLRGAGSTVTRAGEHQARLLVQRGDWDLYSIVQQSALLATEAYWTYVFTIEARGTAVEARDVAQNLLENNEKKKEAGIMTRLDVTQAKAELSRREEELIVANNAMNAAEDELKRLLNPGEALQNWSARVIPLSEPFQEATETPPLAEIVQIAYTERADLKALEIDLGIADLDLAVTENATLPQMDLSANYGLSGLSGKSVDNNKSNFNHFRQSWTPIGQTEFESWGFGVDFSYPLGNQTARAGVRRARIQKEQSRLAWMQKRMEIVQEIRTSLRDVQDGLSRLQASEESERQFFEQWEAEQIRLDNQHATTFDVREAQRDWFSARDEKTRALVDYQIRRATLARFAGILAQRFYVDMEGETPVPGELWEGE